MITIKTPAEIELLRQGGKKLSELLHTLVAAVTPGITTGELDILARELFKKSGGEPTFLGFHGFPGSICISVNEEVVHGIPGKRVLKDGDVVGIDAGLRYKGFCTDTATTVVIGQPTTEVSTLMQVAQESLAAGIAAARIGNRVGDISAAVQATIDPHGYGIVRDLTGHGIGRNQWEEPAIPNFGKPGTGPTLKEGMVIAIEPMVNLGGREVMQMDDDWTIATIDNSIAVHFEHTIAITANGPEILT
jgi:methionyl aminopeptidase